MSTDQRKLDTDKRPKKKSGEHHSTDKGTAKEGRGPAIAQGHTRKAGLTDDKGRDVENPT